jgi:exodeoxyribonuclease-3
MKIITWNINSVRLRLPQVLTLLAEHAPDILCLQETKCPDDVFPADAFIAAGYPHLAYRGEKGYNGVAMISRRPIRSQDHTHWAGKQDCRHLSVVLENDLIIDNFYIPAGGDVADPAVNHKFAHKLRFLAELADWSAQRDHSQPSVLVGDLNIAPREDDVWSHKQLLKVVSHTPVEVDALNRIMDKGNWHDGVRLAIPDGKLYSWWSYRARDWAAANRGRRLDHIWVTPPLRDQIIGAEVITTARGWEKPSDHAPVVLRLDE